MKGRIFCTVVSFVVLVNVFRLVNSAQIIGFSDILVQLDNFNFDLTPFVNLYEEWLDTYHSYIAPDPNFVPAETFGEQLSLFFEAFVDALALLGNFLLFLWDSALSLLSFSFYTVVQFFGFVLWFLGFTA